MTAMAIASMFETPLVIDTLADSAALNHELATAIRARRALDPAGLTRSNRHGWHSDIEIFQWGGAAFQILAQRLFALASEHCADVGQGSAPRYRWIGNGWANIMEHGASNQFHVHPGAYWSAVYYVDDGYGGSTDPGLGGELELEDPRMPMVIWEQPHLRFRPRPDRVIPQHEAFIRPRTGMLLMFPGWLRHGVRPYQGDGERISIAVNLAAAKVAP